MLFRIDRQSPVPIARQLEQQLRDHCASGRLEKGEILPSVRRLSNQLKVNVNTVVRVYEQLAAEGLLESRPGAGFLIAAKASPGQLRAHRRDLEREAAELARRALRLGVGAQALKDLFEDIYNKERRGEG